jgi:hypothetical protein
MIRCWSNELWLLSSTSQNESLHSRWARQGRLSELYDVLQRTKYQNATIYGNSTHQLINKRRYEVFSDEQGYDRDLEVDEF